MLTFKYELFSPCTVYWWINGGFSRIASISKTLIYKPMRTRRPLVLSIDTPNKGLSISDFNTLSMINNCSCLYRKWLKRQRTRIYTAYLLLYYSETLRNLLYTRWNIIPDSRLHASWTRPRLYERLRRKEANSGATLCHQLKKLLSVSGTISLLEL